MSEGKITPIEPGIVARVAAGMRYMFTGETPAWFGAGEPLSPVVPEAEKPSVEGRQFDYPFAVNLQQMPRHNEAVSFAQMRALADGYDLLRLVIETRKDQLARLKWAIKPRGDQAHGDDPRCIEVATFFARPDQENNWLTWLRLLVEDMLVIDAPALYLRRTKGGQLFAAEPVDGASIKRILDDRGRTPLPPLPAYQQMLKGLPAINYSRDELLYLPRNPRTHKVYGFSPVEQIIMTVNIALRRQLHKLSYYSEGSTPDLVFSVPAEWSPEQIAYFENYWNTLLAGDLAERRRTRFVPEGVKPYNTREAALKDEFDDWLARIVCYAFSISPQPLVKEMNRATAEVGQDAALAEGLAPSMAWVKSLMDQLIERGFGYSDLEFEWQDEKSISPAEQAQIDKTYLEAGVLHPDEVRARLGLTPLTPEQKQELRPTTAPTTAPHPANPADSRP